MKVRLRPTGAVSPRNSVPTDDSEAAGHARCRTTEPSGADRGLMGGEGVAHGPIPIGLGAPLASARTHATTRVQIGVLEPALWAHRRVVLAR